ncbi:DNA topoisomerase 3-alpha-like [Senna tora]|uniref:DNA topoisomerase 3-alpha-like n=1 Tax=Senna tora TaxID=362788 RepID=A0A834T054_9FABA|nr:DNA topoisomerase 3-alpha-like [Senna tora]
MASSSIGESRGIPVVGIQNTYCECGIRARIMISESERNPNRLYATCAKYPKCNYYVWLTPRRVGDREPGNQDTNNSVQSSIDNVDSAMLEARFAKIESMLGWIKMCVAFVMFVVLVLLLKDPQLEAEMMNRLQHVLPPFPFEQLLPFPFVQVSFSVPWSENVLTNPNNPFVFGNLIEHAPQNGRATNLQVRDLTLFNGQAMDEHHRLSNNISQLLHPQSSQCPHQCGGQMGRWDQCGAQSSGSWHCCALHGLRRHHLLSLCPLPIVESGRQSVGMPYAFCFQCSNTALDVGCSPQSTARSLSLHHFLQFPQVFPLETLVLVVLRIVHKGQQALDQQFILCTRPYMIDLGARCSAARLRMTVHNDNLLRRK